jgi:hypothetical protein
MDFIRCFTRPFRVRKEIGPINGRRIGGDAVYESLYLFWMDGSAWRVVFAQPMMFGESIAGDRQKDGTRDHEATDGKKVLTVMPGAPSAASMICNCAAMAIARRRFFTGRAARNATWKNNAVNREAPGRAVSGAEIRFQHTRVPEQLAAGALERHRSILQDVSSLRHLQRLAHVLLDEKQRQPVLVDRP